MIEQVTNPIPIPDEIDPQHSIFLILGNQLFPRELLEAWKAVPVFMAEDHELCTYFKHHQQKILLFLAAMRLYADDLQQAGHEVEYHRLEDQEPMAESPDYLGKLDLYLDHHPQINTLVCFEVEDQFFESRLQEHLNQRGMHFHVLPSPMFLTSREDFTTYLNKSKQAPFMARFYQQQRKRLGLLLDEDGKPTGGQWSFDAENRKKLPKKKELPPAFTLNHQPYQGTIQKVSTLIQSHFSSHPGHVKECYFPVRREQALDWLRHFFEHRFHDFGAYEDALSTRDPWLFHSVLSPMMNMGLLLPQEIIHHAITYAAAQDIPINSLEGFIRQIIGWREFVRGIDRHYHERLHTSNHWGHHRQLGPQWYEGDTGLVPLDDVIQKVQTYGWTHHIERLMVVANLMNLCEIHPQESYRWFMEMYVDSSDWVMAPNVMGMGLMSDGGIFATKPYICGSNYILKMSDYKKGDWCDIMDGLYWRFIEKHRDFFEANHRLSMMPRTLDKLNPERKARIFALAEAFIDRVTLRA